MYPRVGAAVHGTEVIRLGATECGAEPRRPFHVRSELAVVVPHLREPIMGSRTKEGQYLHKCKLPVSILQHSAKERESGKTNYLPRCNASSSMVLLVVVLQQMG